MQNTTQSVVNRKWNNTDFVPNMANNWDKKTSKTIDKEIVDKIDGNSINKNKAKNVCYYEQKN